MNLSKKCKFIYLFCLKDKMDSFAQSYADF